MTADSDVKRLAENVSSLQKDMAQIGALVERLDATFDKLTEVSTTVSQLLAVQGSRLEIHEKVQEKLQDLVERRKQETDDNIKEIYNRIEKGEKEIHKDIESIETKIIVKIEEMQKKTTEQGDNFNRTLTERIDRLEKWMWTAIGAGGVLIWILNNIDFVNLLK